MSHVYTSAVSTSNDFYPFQFSTIYYWPLNSCVAWKLTLFNSTDFDSLFPFNLPFTLLTLDGRSQIEPKTVATKRWENHTKTKSNSKMTMLLFKAIPNITIVRNENPFNRYLSNIVGCFVAHVRLFICPCGIFYWTFIHHNSSFCQCPFENLSVHHNQYESYIPTHSNNGAKKEREKITM